MPLKCNSVVYGFRNILRDKWYVGSSSYIPTRRSHHIADLIKQKHHSSKFQNAWNKYGKEAFEFIILEYVPKPEDMDKLEFRPILLAREDYWTEFYDAVKNGYNVALKAGSCLGIKRSAETKSRKSKSEKERWKNILSDETVALEVAAKMGEMAQGFWHSLRQDPEDYDKFCASRRKPRPSMIGRTRAPELVSQLAASNRGKTRTEQTKKQMSESALKAWDGRRGLPASKEHVDIRQTGRNETQYAKDDITLCMGFNLYWTGQVFDKEVDAKIFGYISTLGDAIVSSKHKSRREKEATARSAKRYQQQELSHG